MNIKNMLDLISAVFITSTFTAGLGEASSDLIAGHFSAQIWSHASWWTQTRREHTRAEDKGRIQNRNPRGTNTKSFHLKSKKHLRSTMFSYYLFLRILVCSSERSSDVCLRSRGDETVKQWLRNSRQRPPRTLHQDRSNTLSFRQKKTMSDSAGVLILTASRFMMVCPVSRYTDSRKRTLVTGVG